jgi:2,4-dichlorophenol 6-monooxygenase
MRRERVEVDVLISGAGPVGLACALLLRNLGITVAVIEARAGTHRAPQAHVVSSRTLEILTGAGVPEERLRALSTPITEIPAIRWVDSLNGTQHGCFELLGAGQAEKILAATPTPIANISQDRLEPLLLAEARDAGARVDFGHRWLRSERLADQRLVSHVGVDGGEEVRIRSRFLFACDGASSDIRHACGIEMVGPELVQSFVGIHFHADLRELLAERPALLFEFLGGAAAGFFICHRVDSDWVFMHPYNPETKDRDWFTNARAHQLVLDAIGADVPVEIASVAPWRMSSQVAASYRQGPIFLLGDAAHRFPPTGGIGMNTGIGDAHNLGWKVAMAMGGHADDRLLDTYELERRPVAVANADQSLSNYRKMDLIEEALAGGGDVQAAIDAQPEHFDMLGLDLGYRYRSPAILDDDAADLPVENVVRDVPLGLVPGYRLPHVWLADGGGMVSTLGLVRPDEFVLLTGTRSDLWADAGVAKTDRAAGALLGDIGGLGPEAAVLVRPDGHIAWVCAQAPSDPAAAVAAAIDRLSHP